MSALMIQENEVLVDTYSNKEKVNYGFIVYMIKDGEIHTPIVSTLPHFPYSSEKLALDSGNALVKEVKEIDLRPDKSKLKKIISDEESEVISEIIKESKKS